jgi:hypothetical protein
MQFIHQNENRITKLIIKGACITIQAAWRGYLCRKKLNEAFYETQKLPNKTNQFVLNCRQNVNRPVYDNESSIYLNNFTLRCLKNFLFSYDVLLFVEGNIFYCHSLVLWFKSKVFKNLIEYYDSYDNDSTSIRFKFELLITAKCWMVIHKFIYGYETKITSEIFEEVLFCARELHFEELYSELLIVKKSSNPGWEKSDKSYNSIYYSELFLKEDSYDVFKQVIGLYFAKKISSQKVLDYLTSFQIDYASMNEKQLRKCIYLLKTLMKLKNSRLILNLIDIYLNNNNNKNI